MKIALYNLHFIPAILSHCACSLIFEALVLVISQVDIITMAPNYYSLIGDSFVLFIYRIF